MPYILHAAIRSSLSVQPVKSDRRHRGKKNAVLNDDYEPDDSTEDSSEKETSDNKHSSDTEVSRPKSKGKSDNQSDAILTIGRAFSFFNQRNL